MVEDTHFIIMAQVSGSDVVRFESRVTVLDSAADAQLLLDRQRDAFAGSLAFEDTDLGDDSFSFKANGEFSAYFRTQNVVVQVVTYEDSNGSAALTKFWSQRLGSKIARVRRSGVVRDLRSPYTHTGRPNAHPHTNFAACAPGYHGPYSYADGQRGGPYADANRHPIVAYVHTYVRRLSRATRPNGHLHSHPDPDASAANSDAYDHTHPTATRLPGRF